MRPKESLNDLPENWKEIILDLYSNGGSNIEVKKLIYEWRGKFSNDLWDRWMKEESEFSETIKKGLLFEEAWWIKEGRINLTNNKFNYTGWYMQMKNRFNWKDRQDITTGGEKLNITFTRNGSEN
jgi:hypothetical protein